ncbi:Pseudouridine synthase family protein [Thalictrum thalictroides]|uniref:Pseudouridine synthase family protein n=1 Tax=Thalictrum thalictroides TaxID=46969 RepID=A0A7J6VQV8_THATH|nr:Pseudouridine synthase family protein [Thalictrum thalictroides]
MTASSLRLSLSPWIKNPNFKSSFITNTKKSPSYSSSLDQLKQQVEEGTGDSWEPYRKKKVVMRVGYIGTNYRGLQIQRDEHSFTTVEAELESAIFRAGGI